MKSKYMMGLMCAFCFGVLGKTALDAVGFEVVAAARADVAGMNSRDLLRDRDFRRAVESIIADEGLDMVGTRIYNTAVSEINSRVPGIVKSVVGLCTVYVDGDYGDISCR
mgnify:CR=1 FL=1